MGTQSRRIARNRTLRPVWVEDITAAQERARVAKEAKTAREEAEAAEKGPSAGQTAVRGRNV